MLGPAAAGIPGVAERLAKGPRHLLSIGGFVDPVLRGGDGERAAQRDTDPGADLPELGAHPFDLVGLVLQLFRVTDETDDDVEHTVSHDRSPGPLGAAAGPFLVAQHLGHLLEQTGRHGHHVEGVDTPDPADTGGDRPLSTADTSPGLPGVTISRSDMRRASAWSNVKVGSSRRWMIHASAAIALACDRSNATANEQPSSSSTSASSPSVTSA